MNRDDAFDALADDIRGAIGSTTTGSGFHPINCPMCKNREQGQKKGGFKFEHEQIIYNCFRGSCDATTVYTKGEPIPKKFRALMDVLGVTIPIQLRSYKKRSFKEEQLDDRFEKNVYKTMTLPEECRGRNLGDKWVDFLVGRECIYYDLDFRVVTGGPYKGSLVIPHYFYDKLIGWVYVTKSGRYVTEKGSSESMLFIPSKIIPERPLIIEGQMDALCFPDTVATCGPKITPKQAYHLRHSNPIVLPDRHGSKLYESAKEYGFDVSLPMWSEKDLNAAVINRGIMVAAHMIHKGIMKPGPKSDILYKRWTKNK